MFPLLLPSTEMGRSPGLDIALPVQVGYYRNVHTFVITTEQKLHKQTPAMGIQKDNGVTDDRDNSGNHALSIREKIGDLAQFSRLDMQSAPFFII